MPGNNYRFLIASEGLDDFRIAMGLAFKAGSRKSATSYEFDPERGMIFYWTDMGESVIGVQRLPYPMDLEAATVFAWGWLRKTEYPTEPNHDGSNNKGFRVYNEEWGHVKGRWQAFVAIKPEWQMYGK